MYLYVPDDYYIEIKIDGIFCDKQFYISWYMIRIIQICYYYYYER